MTVDLTDPTAAIRASLDICREMGTVFATPEDYEEWCEVREAAADEAEAAFEAECERAEWAETRFREEGW